LKTKQVRNELNALKISLEERMKSLTNECKSARAKFSERQAEISEDYKKIKQIIELTTRKNHD
jgi:hypothetical protein